MEWDRLDIGSLHIDWVIVISIAVLVIAAGMIIFVIIENRRSKFIFGLRLLLEVNEYFHSGAMLGTRQKAAAALINDSYDENVEDLLDFFEMVGYLSKRHAIKRELIWHNISHWIIRYGYAAKIYREEDQQKLPRRWENLTALCRHLSRMERRKYGVSVVTQESVKEFLDKERDILSK